MKDNVDDIIKAAISAVDWKEFRGEFTVYKHVENETFIYPGATVNNYYGNSVGRAENKGLSEVEKEALASEIEMCFSNTDGKTREQWAELFVTTADGMANGQIYDLVAAWISHHRFIDGYTTWRRLGQPLARYGIWQSSGDDDKDMNNWNKAIRRANN